MTALFRSLPEIHRLNALCLIAAETIPQGRLQLWQQEILQGEEIISMLIVGAPPFADRARRKTVEFLATVEQGDHVIHETITLGVRHQILDDNESLFVIRSLLLRGQTIGHRLDIHVEMGR